MVLTRCRYRWTVSKTPAHFFDMLLGVFPHVCSSPRGLVVTFFPATGEVMRDVDLEDMVLKRMQVVEFCLTVGPFAVKNLIRDCRHVLDGHLDVVGTQRSLLGPADLTLLAWGHPVRG
jgi:hypothetical protein